MKIRLFYVSIAAALIAAFWPALMENRRVHKVSEGLELADVKLLTAAELDAEFNRMHAAYSTDKMERVAKLQELNVLRKEVDRKFRKFTREHGRHSNDLWVKWDSMALNFNGAAFNDRQRRYIEKFGHVALQRSADDFYAKHPELLYTGPPDVPNDLWRLFWIGYVRSFGVMLLFFTMRAQRHGLSPIAEFLWRIAPAAALWPIAIFLYPQRIDAKKAARQTLHALVYANSLMYTFACMIGGGFASAVAKAQTSPAFPIGKTSSKEAGKKRKQRGTLVVSTGIASQMVSDMSASVFLPKPDLSSAARINFANGLSIGVTNFAGLDDIDPSSNFGDWIVEDIGFRRPLPGGFAASASVMHMNTIPYGKFPDDDYLVFSANMSRRTKVGSAVLTPYVTYRETLRLGRQSDRGTFGYVGTSYDFDIGRIPVRTRHELKIDPGNLGKAAGLYVSGRVEMPVPVSKDRRFTLAPFIGVSGPIWKDRSMPDPRSWEVFGGFSLSYSLPF